MSGVLFTAGALEGLERSARIESSVQGETLVGRGVGWTLSGVAGRGGERGGEGRSGREGGERNAGQEARGARLGLPGGLPLGSAGKRGSEPPPVSAPSLLGCGK